MVKSVLTLLVAIRSVALTGLQFSENAHDIKRYERLIDITSLEYWDLTGRHYDWIRRKLLKEIGSITPKVVVEAAVFNANGKILLINRQDDNC